MGREYFEKFEEINDKYSPEGGEGLGESMKEEFRIWGDEEISAQNNLVKWEHALEDFLENNNIEYDQVKCDIFDYGTNIVIVNPEDIEEVAQEIEDHYGFKTTIEDNNIYVDVTEEYEDEYGDIKTRVAKRYDESLDSEVTLQELADEIDYNGADYRGAEIPKAIDYMINQINIPDNMRLKWFDVDVVSDDVIQLTYVTQEPFSPTDSDSFIKEVTNMINVLANKYRYNKPFTLALDVTARDGRDEGQLVYDIKVNAGADMSLKEDISSKKYTLESKLYDYFKATNPNDPFGDGIDKEATFRDLFNAINDNANVYKVIFGNENSGDSAVREELFNGLANILNTSYDDVYHAWLGYHPLLESNNIIDIRKELNRLDSEEYRDLLNMYDSIELAEHEKKHIAELISQNKIDELVDYLQELYYVYINVYDGNGNGIVTNDLGTFYKKDDLLDDGKFYKHEGLNDKTLKEDIDWDYFDQFETIINKYLPDYGEGNTFASQAVTAVNKLIYKWFNDGDVYDNNYALSGWVNDLSSFANWLYTYVKETRPILKRISKIKNEAGYEYILLALAMTVLTEDFLSKYSDKVKTGSIYRCDGPFSWVDLSEYDEDEEDWYEEEDDYYDESLKEDYTPTSLEDDDLEESFKSGATVYEVSKDGLPEIDRQFITYISNHREYQICTRVEKSNWEKKSDAKYHISPDGEFYAGANKYIYPISYNRYIYVDELGVKKIGEELSEAKKKDEESLNTSSKEMDEGEAVFTKKNGTPGYLVKDGGKIKFLRNYTEDQVKKLGFIVKN